MRPLSLGPVRLVVALLACIGIGLVAIRGDANAPPGRYVVQNGTVKDTATGLVWQQTVEPTAIGWAPAMAYCDVLELDGTGWRAPSIKELYTLIDQSQSDPVPKIDQDSFPEEVNQAYWSSSTDASDASRAWFVYFGQGWSDLQAKTLVSKIRCVR
jgi:hypothetical protein